MALALALGLTAPAAQAQDTETSEATAAILTPLSLVKTADMDFGNIVRPAAAGTVILDPQPVATCTITGGVLVRFGNCEAARFSGYGAANQTIRIQMPNVPIVISNGPRTMQITPRTMDYDPDLQYISGNMAANGNVRMRIISSDGVFDFRFGGTLNVGANQDYGLYTGTFSVTVTYD